jgi:hypothetical protein
MKFSSNSESLKPVYQHKKPTNAPPVDEDTKKMQEKLKLATQIVENESLYMQQTNEINELNNLISYKKSQKEIFYSCFENSSIPMMFLSIEGNILSLNQSFRRKYENGLKNKSNGHINQIFEELDFTQLRKTIEKCSQSSEKKMQFAFKYEGRLTILSLEIMGQDLTCFCLFL